MKQHNDTDSQVKSQLEDVKENLPVTFQFTKIQFFEKGIISGNATEGDGYLELPKYQTPMTTPKNFHKHITRMVKLNGEK